MIKEWQLPTPWDEPYDVVEAKDGEIWTGSMMTDRVARLDSEDRRHRRVSAAAHPPTSAASSSTIAALSRCSGSAATTAPRS